MPENKDHDYSADPSQVSESGEGDSSSLLLNSSKLRTKLEKLAKWRIDPSLIEFPEDTPEFRGGYATVLRAFLASSSSTEGLRNEPKPATDDHSDPDAGNPQSQNDTQEHKFDQQGKDEKDSRTTDKDLTEEERRNTSDTYEGQPEFDRSTFTPRVDDEPEPPEIPAAREDLDSEDAQPQRDTQHPGDDHQNKDQGIDGRTIDGDNDETKEAGREDSENLEEQRSHPQASLSTIEDGSGSPEHTADKNLSSGSLSAQPQSDTQGSGDGQQHNDEGSGSPIPDSKNDQAKAKQKSDRQTSEPKIVAIKKLKLQEDTDSKRVLGLALRESEFLTGLSHPNIVKFEGFVEDLSTQKVWLIFPWEEHGNLRDFLASGEWEIPERISLINDVTQGLEYLHSQEPPIYHGDLKSLNILVNSECYALITDFGSARSLDNDGVGKRTKDKEGPDKPQTATRDSATVDEHITLEAIFSATASTLTLTGSSYTLRWAAPELLQDDEPCLRSDIWALGWIAYEVMTNTIPFHDIKKNAIVINHVIQGKLPSITEDARMSLIRALCSLMVRCWSINPDKRPTAEECRKLISWMPMIVPVPAQAMAEEASQLRHARLLNKLGHMYNGQADYSGALSSFTAALDIYTTHNDRNGRAETLRYLADAHRFRAEYTEAIKFYSEALEILTELGPIISQDWRGIALFGLATTHLLCRDNAQAGKLYSECLQIYTSTGNKRERASALWGLAQVRKEQAKYSEAIDLYSEAQQIYTEVGDLREGALTLCGLAEIHRLQGEYNEAVNLYSEALQTYTDVGDLKERATTLFNLALTHAEQSRYKEAGDIYSESLQVYIDIGDRQGRGHALWGLAEMHSARQEYDQAAQLYSEAIQTLSDIGDDYWKAEALMGYAQTNKMRGRLSEAISLYTQASEVLEEIGDSNGASGALESAADVRKTLERATADSEDSETVKGGEEPLPT